MIANPEQHRVTVMIMTLNEESNIAGAIESFPQGTPIVVFDSFSTDHTVDLARQAGAEVVQRKFDNWAAHQNWGAANIQFPTPWVYYSDADERMTPELWSEIRSAVHNPGPNSAFAMRRKDMFMGRWLRRSSFYPHWFVRLYRPGKIRWERLVNPTSVVDGPVGRLENHFLHFPFSKGTGQWFRRHVEYAEFEALEILKAAPVSWSGLVSRDGLKRRETLKRLFYKLPARPIIKFVVLYFFRRGFADGRPGLYYALMQSIYEFMIVLRTRELRRRESGLPV